MTMVTAASRINMVMNLKSLTKERDISTYTLGQTSIKG